MSVSSSARWWLAGFFASVATYLFMFPIRTLEYKRDTSAYSCVVQINRFTGSVSLWTDTQACRYFVFQR